MGVYIPNMEKPKHCSKCPIFDYEYGCPLVLDKEQCPLIEINDTEWEWCHDCKEYDQEAHCCHRWTKVIRNTVAELEERYGERRTDEIDRR